MSDPKNLAIEKLLGLQGREDEVRDQSIQVLLKDPRTTGILGLIELALDLMIRTAGVPQPTEDGTTVSAIAGRIFNTTAGCLREALSGYFQTSLMIMRDLVEIQFLLDYFADRPEQIARWREVTNPERLREFSPRQLREALDERDGFTGGVRRAHYEQFSEYASHLTYPALRTLQTPEGFTQLGPLLREEHLKHCIYELGRRVVFCAVTLMSVLPLKFRDNDVEAGIRLDADLDRLQAMWNELYPAEQPASNQEGEEPRTS